MSSPPAKRKDPLLKILWQQFWLYLWDTAKWQPTQNTFKHKLLINSITHCDINIQIVTHRVDWFSCVAFVLLQNTQARLPFLYCKLHVDGHKFHWWRLHTAVRLKVMHRWYRRGMSNIWPAGQKRPVAWLDPARWMILWNKNFFVCLKSIQLYLNNWWL